MTESSLLLPLKRLLANAILRRRAWPQWEIPRDCSRWKVAPKAQPVSMLFTFFESCWVEKKKFTFLFHFQLWQAWHRQRISTKITHGQIKVKFGVASLWRLPTTTLYKVSLLPWLIAPTPANLISESSGLEVVLPRPSRQDLLDKQAFEFFSLIPKQNTTGGRNQFRGRKEHIKLHNS